MAVAQEADELVPISVLRAEAGRLQQSLARRPYDPALDLNRLADGRRDAQRPLVRAGQDQARIQHELDEMPLIARLHRRHHRAVLEQDLNHLDRDIGAQTARLRLLQGQRDGLRPAEEAWRAWHTEHKPDLDRLATLRLRISLAENLRPEHAQVGRAAAPTLEAQPEPGGIDVSV